MRQLRPRNTDAARCVRLTLLVDLSITLPFIPPFDYVRQCTVPPHAVSPVYCTASCRTTTGVSRAVQYCPRCFAGVQTLRQCQFGQKHCKNLFCEGWSLCTFNVPLEKLIAVWFLEKCISVFTKACNRYVFCSKLIHSSPFHFMSLRSILILHSSRRLDIPSLHHSRQELYMCFSSLRARCMFCQLNLPGVIFPYNIYGTVQIITLQCYDLRRLLLLI